MSGGAAHRRHAPLTPPTGDSSSRPMTSAEEVAIPEPIASAAAPKFATRVLGPVAVLLALLSAVVTFVVLAGLTPIVPTHNVVVTVLLLNAAATLILLAIIIWEV